MSRKIKILHFELSDNVGGIESFLLNLYTAIDRDRYQFDFVTTSDHPALGKQLEALGGHIYQVAPYKQAFSYSRDIRKVMAGGYELWRKTHRLACGMKATFLCKTAFPPLDIYID